MGTAWGLVGVSPFLSERARVRAPQILSYAAVSGTALLASPRHDVVMVAGAAADLDLERVTRQAFARGAAHHVCSFRVGDACVHAGPVSGGWILVVLATVGVSPGVLLDRLQRASQVMALALADGAAGSPSGGSSPTGAPAEVAVLSRRRGPNRARWA